MLLNPKHFIPFCSCTAPNNSQVHYSSTMPKTSGFFPPNPPTTVRAPFFFVSPIFPFILCLLRLKAVSHRAHGGDPSHRAHGGEISQKMGQQYVRYESGKAPPGT
jgi:hypothetical protein